MRVPQRARGAPSPAPASGGDESWSFTILVTDGEEVIGRHDPTLTARTIDAAPPV